MCQRETYYHPCHHISLGPVLPCNQPSYPGQPHNTYTFSSTLNTPCPSCASIPYYPPLQPPGTTYGLFPPPVPMQLPFQQQYRQPPPMYYTLPTQPLLYPQPQVQLQQQPYYLPPSGAYGTPLPFPPGTGLSTRLERVGNALAPVIHYHFPPANSTPLPPSPSFAQGYGTPYGYNLGSIPPDWNPNLGNWRNPPTPSPGTGTTSEPPLMSGGLADDDPAAGTDLGTGQDTDDQTRGPGTDAAQEPAKDGDDQPNQTQTQTLDNAANTGPSQTDDSSAHAKDPTAKSEAKNPASQDQDQNQDKAHAEPQKQELASKSVADKDTQPGASKYKAPHVSDEDEPSGSGARTHGPDTVTSSPISSGRATPASLGDADGDGLTDAQDGSKDEDKKDRKDAKK